MKLREFYRKRTGREIDEIVESEDIIFFIDDDEDGEGNKRQYLRSICKGTISIFNLCSFEKGEFKNWSTDFYCTSNEQLLNKFPMLYQKSKLKEIFDAISNSGKEYMGVRELFGVESLAEIFEIKIKMKKIQEDILKVIEMLGRLS